MRRKTPKPQESGRRGWLSTRRRRKERQSQPQSPLSQWMSSHGVSLTTSTPSQVILIKAIDDETNMKVLEASVRSIEKDGLVWGLSKLVPVGFGIKKLQINLVIEDDKIGLDDLQEEIQGFDDYVQSTDIVSIDCCPMACHTNS
jgi:translation elongation factor EF-1beta